MNKLKILILIFAIIIAALAIRLGIMLIPKNAEKTDTSEGIGYLSQLESADANAVENSIRQNGGLSPAATAPAATVPAATDPGASVPAATVPAATAAAAPASGVIQVAVPAGGYPAVGRYAEVLESGNFRPAFKDIIISGDSIVKAIWEYNVLDKSQVLAEISAGANYLNKIADDLVAANPAYLILHYGENEVVESESQAQSFIASYKSAIQNLQQRLPYTKIYVDCIFPVKEFSFKKEPYLVNIPRYNELLQQMAAELGVPFLDYTNVWNSYEKNYYDADGIHPIKSYYTEQYLPYILTQLVVS
ncbi:MAG: hypothetical protein IK118_03760 [Clostridia bacterium]|nr:hypothetical protein [Clostridia bacterium]